MKLLVFAHTPPPHHGQSQMVERMLCGFAEAGGDGPNPAAGLGIRCYHVNCRVSEGMHDIGAAGVGKVLRLLRYCGQAVWLRVRHGISVFYYVPAPGKSAALYRDWIAMALCRPFFRRVVFHWHAVGLAEWLETQSPWKRAVSRWLLGRPALSIVQAQASAGDAAWFRSQKTIIVPNGIPDPCPDFERLAAERRARVALAETATPSPASPESAPALRIYYMAHCIREKGLFDALEGVAIFNERQRGKTPEAAQAPLQAHLHVAGAFMNAPEEAAFWERVRRPDLAGAVTYCGFLADEAKWRLLAESDALCFPTYYPAESFGLTVVEAMAFGLPAIVTPWRAIPEILGAAAEHEKTAQAEAPLPTTGAEEKPQPMASAPPNYPLFVAPQQPPQIADALGRATDARLRERLGRQLRARFLGRFSEEPHLRALAAALRGVE